MNWQLQHRVLPIDHFLYELGEARDGLLACDPG